MNRVHAIGDVVRCTTPYTVLQKVNNKEPPLRSCIAKASENAGFLCGVVFVLPAGQTEVPSWMLPTIMPEQYYAYGGPGWGLQIPYPPSPVPYRRYLVRSLEIRESYKSLNESGFCLPKKFYAWLGEDMLDETPVKLEENTFPIAQLPLPVLGLVFLHLPIGEGALQSQTCRKFHCAFRDESVWKERCIKGTPDQRILAATDSFFLAYKQYCIWHINVVLVHRRYSSRPFTVAVSPHMCVHEFEQMVASHRENSFRSSEGLAPHNPAILNRDRSDWLPRPVDEPKMEPNCLYNSKDPFATLASVGLCDGAILELDLRKEYSRWGN